MDCNYLGIAVGFGLSFAPYGISYLTNSISSKLRHLNKDFDDVQKHLGEPRLSKKGIDEIKAYCPNLSSESQEIIYKLLDEIEEREVEAKKLGKNLESSLIKKYGI